MVCFLICSSTIDICELPLKDGVRRSLELITFCYQVTIFWGGWLSRGNARLSWERNIPLSIITDTHLQKTPWAYSTSAQCFLTGQLGATPHIVSPLYHKYLNCQWHVRGHAFAPQCVMAWKWKHQLFTVGWMSLYDAPFFICKSICADGSIIQALRKYAGGVVFKTLNWWLEPLVNPSRGRKGRIWPDSRSLLRSFSCLSINRM